MSAPHTELFITPKGRLWIQRHFSVDLRDIFQWKYIHEPFFRTAGYGKSIEYDKKLIVYED